jgi:superfamily II DNA/RNA helicase
VQRIITDSPAYLFHFSAIRIPQSKEMNRILQTSSFHLRTLRLTPLSSVMTAVYSTSSLKLANATPFNSLTDKLDPGILKALGEMQYEYMTPVQEKVLSSMPSLRSDW